MIFIISFICRQATWVWKKIYRKKTKIFATDKLFSTTLFFLDTLLEREKGTKLGIVIVSISEKSDLLKKQVVWARLIDLAVEYWYK